MRPGFVVAVVIAVGLGAYLTGRCGGTDNGGEVDDATAVLDTASIARRAVERAMEERDSVEAARQAELRAERERAEVRARAAELRVGVLTIRLRERVDEDTRPLLDSLVVAHAQETAELRAIIVGQDSLAASLRGQILTRDALIGALQEELTASERVAQAWQARYEAETSWWRGLGKSSGTLAIGVGVGAVAACLLAGCG